jgi:hypothetical protein
MKSLASITPSPEQLLIIKRVRAGVELIRGSAGSGKTTTAILKLRLFALWVGSRRKRLANPDPVKALVLTFNKTLRGYIENLVLQNAFGVNIALEIETIGHWAYRTLGGPLMCEGNELESFAASAAVTGLTIEFVINEAQYLMGRFPRADLTDYLTCRRDGRGASPRVERAVRQEILDKVIYPYNAWKEKNGRKDWNDLALEIADKSFHQYDVIIVDESQDFSANQLRAVLNQLGPEGAASFIIDTAQRIYAGGFTWAEIGLTIRPENSHRLSVNYRNTPETARLAAGLMSMVPLDDDGAPPAQGGLFVNPRPLVLKGYYPQQVAWCINYINTQIDLKNESVAFLHPKGWFTFLKGQLDAAGIDYVSLTRQSDWPTSNVNIALSTLHSAKGLDFDYVFLIGIDKQSFADGDFDIGDDRFENACRLLAMAIARSRIRAVLGYKIGEEPNIISKLDPAAFDEIML